MQITDPIADLLTRIRNASTAKHPSVEIPASNMKKAICQILVDEGYIKGMQVKNDTVQGTIVVTLKYQANGEPVIAGLRKKGVKDNVENWKKTHRHSCRRYCHCR